MKKLGVIVNPVAGMGGQVGLKGSDGAEILTQAIKLGAQPESPKRAVMALRALSKMRAGVEIITYPFEMGQEECREAGFEPVVVGCIRDSVTRLGCWGCDIPFGPPTAVWPVE